MAAWLTCRLFNVIFIWISPIISFKANLSTSDSENRLDYFKNHTQSTRRRLCMGSVLAHSSDGSLANFVLI